MNAYNAIPQIRKIVITDEYDFVSYIFDNNLKLNVKYIRRPNKCTNRFDYFISDAKIINKTKMEYHLNRLLLVINKYHSYPHKIYKVPELSLIWGTEHDILPLVKIKNNKMSAVYINGEFEIAVAFNDYRNKCNIKSLITHIEIDGKVRYVSYKLSKELTDKIKKSILYYENHKPKKITADYLSFDDAFNILKERINSVDFIKFMRVYLSAYFDKYTVKDDTIYVVADRIINEIKEKCRHSIYPMTIKGSKKSYPHYISIVMKDGVYKIILDDCYGSRICSSENFDYIMYGTLSRYWECDNASSNKLIEVILDGIINYLVFSSTKNSNRFASFTSEELLSITIKAPSHLNNEISEELNRRGLY